MSQSISLFRVIVAGQQGFTAWFEGMRVVIAAHMDEQQEIESVLARAGINFQPFTADEAGAPSLPGFRVVYTTDRGIDEAINDLDELFEHYEPELPVFTYHVGEVDLVFYIGTKPQLENERYYITFGSSTDSLDERALKAYAAALFDGASPESTELMAAGIKFEEMFTDSIHVSMPDTVVLGEILPLIAKLCP